MPVVDDLVVVVVLVVVVLVNDVVRLLSSLRLILNRARRKKRQRERDRVRSGFVSACQTRPVKSTYLNCSRDSMISFLIKNNHDLISPVDLVLFLASVLDR